MLDLMQPARPGGRIGESWLTGLDETGRQVAPKTRLRKGLYPTANPDGQTPSLSDKTFTFNMLMSGGDCGAL